VGDIGLLRTARQSERGPVLRFGISSWFRMIVSDRCREVPGEITRCKWRAWLPTSFFRDARPGLRYNRDLRGYRRRWLDSLGPAAAWPLEGNPRCSVAQTADCRESKPPAPRGPAGTPARRAYPRRRFPDRRLGHAAHRTRGVGRRGCVATSDAPRTSLRGGRGAPRRLCSRGRQRQGRALYQNARAWLNMLRHSMRTRVQGVRVQLGRAGRNAEEDGGGGPIFQHLELRPGRPRGPGGRAGRGTAGEP
jgi:hypothetical protein